MRLLIKLLKAINSEARPWQIAVAVTLGMIMGLTPLYRLHNLLILFIALFVRVNFASFLASFLLFSGIAWMFDPVMNSMGESMLMASGWQGVWTGFFNTTLGQLSQFNHTLTIGGLALSLLLVPVVLPGSWLLVVQYRARFMKWVNKLRVMQVIKASKFMRLYASWGN